MAGWVQDLNASAGVTAALQVSTDRLRQQAEQEEVIQMARGRRTIATAISLSLAMAAAGCESNSPQNPPVAGTSSVVGTPSAKVFPPALNEATVVPKPVARLQPGIQVLVGDGPATTVCTTGFYVDFPDPHASGGRSTGFLTGAQCANGDEDAPVAVMKIEDAGLAPTRTKIGEIAYLTAGEARPRVADEAWTMPTSPLALFSSGPGAWPLPVDGTVNGRPPTADTVETIDVVQHNRARAAWTDLDGGVVGGHVVDPAVTAEVRDIPAGIDRVVVAVDNVKAAIDAKIIGAPVTADVDGSIANLGIITGIDVARHWVVVDLIGPFLTRQGAALIGA
ncbi:hypothetical protein [Mycobacterium sp. SMC-11]|uniref:hypothetical protein n=1 Tax=Mycobacterium sp. SMC-11 TaxID=3385969 RepID=UPI00390CA905